MSPIVLAGIIIILVWSIIMVLLLTSTETYKSAFDRLTKARWRNDRAALQVMVDHLRSFPGEWSISRDSASYPLQGAKKVYLNYDKNKDQWNYSLTAFGGDPRPLNGHFGKEISTLLVQQNNNRETKSLLRDFFPELNDTLMIGGIK